MTVPSPAQYPLPPAPPRRRPWPARWWAITFIHIPVALVLLLCTIGMLAQDETAERSADDDRAATDTDADAADAADDAADDEEAAEPDLPKDWFEAETFTGSGDDVITLPQGALEGMVTASHDGSSNFVITALDANNESTFDLLVNEIGSYTGTTAFGLLGIGGDPAALEVVADGAWEITVAHLSTAPVLELPVEGRGDAVFSYDGGPDRWHLTHDGQSNFIVGMTTAMMGLVNEIGPYEGTKTVTGGEAIVTIRADGNWAISAD